MLQSPSPFFTPVGGCLKTERWICPSYYIAGLLALNGRNPYHPVELGLTAESLGLADPIYPYIYFPAIALAFMPLSLLDYPVVQSLWFVCSQLFFWFAILLIFRITTICYKTSNVSITRKILLIIPVTCISYPLVVNFQHGQINTLILFLLCTFLFSLMTGSNIISGIALGMVIMIKPQPLIIIPYLLFRKRFRCAIAAIVTVIAGTATTASVIGWDHFRYYLREVLPTFSMVETTFPPIPLFVPANQSVHGLVSRLFSTTQYTKSIFQYPEIIRPVSGLVVLIILSISFYTIWRWQRFLIPPQQALFRDGSFLLITSILLSPITWDHHLIVAYIAAVYLLFENQCVTRKKTLFPAMVICWILMMSPLYPFSSIWTYNALTALGTSLKAFSLIGFWALFAFGLRPANAGYLKVTSEQDELYLNKGGSPE